jgi:MFS superfamily sulfate permease-like transporter
VDGNIKVAGVHRALSWLYALCAVLLFVLFLQAVFSKTPESRPSGVLLVFTIALGVFALHRIAGRGAAQNKPWARTLSRVIAVFLLLGFPIGTAIGLFILYNSRQKRWPSIVSSEAAASA